MTAEQLGPITITTEIRPVFQEAEIRKSIGVALLIVGIDKLRNGDNTTDPLIWTITELEEKAETEKKAGEISLPAETKKEGELRMITIRGALAEFCNDDAIPHLVDNLFMTDGSYKERGIMIKNNPADLAVLIYTGSLDIPFVPESAMEVKANGWIARSKIRGMDGVRSVLNQAIEFDFSEGITGKAIEAYYSNSEMIQLFYPEFSMKNFYIEREKLQDVPIFPRIKYE